MRFVLTATFIAAYHFCLAQSNIDYTLNTTGGSATSSSSHLEWSLGEMVSIDLYSSANTVITAGLLQGIPSVSTSIPVLPLPANAVTFFPNPTTEQHLHGNFRFTQSGELYIRLLDIKGQALRSWKMPIRASGLQQLSLEGLAAGSYFTEVIFKPVTGSIQKGIYTIVKLQ